MTPNRENANFHTDWFQFYYAIIFDNCWKPSSQRNTLFYVFNRRHCQQTMNSFSLHSKGTIEFAVLSQLHRSRTLAQEPTQSLTACHSAEIESKHAFSTFLTAIASHHQQHLISRLCVGTLHKQGLHCSHMASCCCPQQCCTVLCLDYPTFPHSPRSENLLQCPCQYIKGMAPGCVLDSLPHCCPLTMLWSRRLR